MARRSTHAMRTRTPLDPAVDTYRHPEATNLLRPDVGTQPYFPKSKRKPPTRYRYDSSLSPELAWDGGNAARELGEWLIGPLVSADLSGLHMPACVTCRREMPTDGGDHMNRWITLLLCLVLTAALAILVILGGASPAAAAVADGVASSSESAG